MILKLKYTYRSLQNHRTRIHKNLFAAIAIQVIVRLTIYMDQIIFKPEQVVNATVKQNVAESTVDQFYIGASGIHQTVNTGTRRK